MLPGKPCSLGGEDSHLSLMLLPAGFSSSHDPRLITQTLLLTQSAFLRSFLKIQGVGGQLTPVHFGRKNSRVVRCYALFNGWLLLSLPPTCFRDFTSFVT